MPFPNRLANDKIAVLPFAPCNLYSHHPMHSLRTATRQGDLHRVTRPGDVDDTLATLMQTEWVVYSKACVSHTDTVVAYLARYSHRIAIGDQRIVDVDDEQVVFRYKDYRDHNKPKVMRRFAGVLVVARLGSTVMLLLTYHK